MMIGNYTINLSTAYLEGSKGFDPSTIDYGGYLLSPECFKNMAELKFNYFNYEFSRLLFYMFAVIILFYVLYYQGYGMLSYLKRHKIIEGDIDEAHAWICTYGYRIVTIGYVLLLLKYYLMTTI